MGRRESVGKEGLDGGKTQVVSLAEVAGKIAWDGELEVAVVGLSLTAAPLTKHSPCLLYSASFLLSGELLSSNWSWWSFTSLSRELNWVEMPCKEGNSLKFQI